MFHAIKSQGVVFSLDFQGCTTSQTDHFPEGVNTVLVKW